MRAIVCGGRNLTDSEFVFRELDRIHSERHITLVVEGGQRTRDREKGTIGGADFWANRWAATRGVPVAREDADWHDLTHPGADIRTDRYGRQYDKNAGPRRNALMLTKYQAEAVIAFPGRAGTRNMSALAMSHGVELIVVKP